MSNSYKRVLVRFEKAVRDEMNISPGTSPEYIAAKRDLVQKLTYRENRQAVIGICNPTPLSDEEVEYHRRQGTIVP